MKCDQPHNDPNDITNDKHIAECYNAWEIYIDPDGLDSQESFENMTIKTKLAIIKQL